VPEVDPLRPDDDFSGFIDETVIAVLEFNASETFGKTPAVFKLRLYY
jgi:hypothetical protein